MTKIKAITAKGFKSFAKHTEIVFGDNYNSIIGPNGAGKSSSYDTVITLSNGQEVELGKLVNDQLKSSKDIKTLKDGIYCDENSLSILSINPKNMKTEKKKISKFIKREGEELYQIKTRSGREVKATECHPVMIFKEGILKSVLIRDLKENQLIAVPRKIDTLPDLKFNKDKARIIGYLIGDGYLAKDRIEFVNKDKEIIDDFRITIKKLYPNIILRERDEKGIKRFYFRNKDIVKEIKDLFIKDYEGSITGGIKKIPNMLLRTNNDTIRQVLSGLFDTDGYIRKDRGIIEFCSKNRELVNQMQRLLLRFDILSKIKIRTSYARNTKNKTKRNYFYMYTYGYENLKKFYINIPLTCKYKSEILQNWSEKKLKSNPNLDLLPKETNKYIKELSNLLGLKVKNLRKEYPKLVAYYENRCLPTREGIKEILILYQNKLTILLNHFKTLKFDQNNLVDCMDILNISGRSASKQIGLTPQIIRDHWATNKFNARTENLQNFYNFIKSCFETRLIEIKKNMEILTNLIYSDVYWDEVVEIKKTEKEEFVYDLMVDNNHNFIGNGIFVHNSNICDVMTFVLGKISAKSMRAEKAANLIYNGGKNNQPSKEAVASIIFDNSKKDFPLTDKTVKITRIVRAKGASIYKINDKTVTRQQVLDLLSMGKIDPDGHNVILQGDIVRFTEMKPESRKEVIEEISGISIYDDKKLKAMNELDKVEERLKEADIILTERKSHLRELKNERDQALKYKDLEKKIKDNKATFLHLQIKDKENSRTEVEKKINEHKFDTDKIQLKIDDFKKIINDKKEEIKNINSEIEQRGEKEQLKLHKEVEELKTDLLKQTTRVDTCKNEIERNNKRKGQLRLDSAGLLRQITELKKKLDSLNKNKKNILDQENKILQDIKNFKQKHGIKEGDDWESKIELLSEEISKLTEEKQDILRDHDRLSFQLEDIDKKLNSDGEKIDLTGLRKEFKDITLRLSKCLNSDCVYASKLGNLRGNLVNFNEELAKLNVQSASVRARSFDNLATEKILKSGINGIYNTVSELGRVDGKYSLALEVAAGPRMKSIVVEDDAVASKCIKYLKDNRLGVVTFLPLNKIKGFPAFNSMRTNGVHDLAINLVRFDPKFSKVFSYVFGNTMVVDNLNVARRIGVGKIRMVTLEGDLVEMSGAMVGGFRKSRGVAFKEVNFDNKISELEGKVSSIRNEIGNLQEQREENEELISKLRENKAGLEGEIIKVERTKGIFDISKLKEDKKEIRINLREFKSRLNGIAKDLINKTKELSEFKAKKSKLIGNRTLNEFSTKKQESREELIKIESEIKNLNTQLGFISNENVKILSIIRNHDKEIEEFASEILNLSKLVNENNQVLKVKEKKEKLFYNEFKDLFNKRNKFNDFIQNKETVLIREEERIRSVQDRINTVNLVRAKVVAELEGLQREFEPFKDGKIRRGINLDEIRFEIQDAEKNLNKLGNVNLRALEVYEELEKDYTTLVDKSDKLRLEKDDVFNLMNEIEGQKNDLFMKTFKVLNDNFKHIFLNLFTKGDAFLELENKENPLDGGVDIKVRLVGNKFLDIKSLSGGEKTMTALAFIFAIQEFQPAKFYLLDEVDAALDKTNSEKLSRLIAQYSKNAQYIVISHNDAVIAEANQIYGVSMQNGVSKVVSLKI